MATTTATISRRARRRTGPRKGDLRERAILDAAERLLAAPGYERTTVEEIARGAGITRPSLYFYFDSKQAVMAAVVARALAGFDAAREGVVDDDLPAERAIARGLELAAEPWREHTAVMLFAARNAHAIHEVGAMWEATRARAREGLADLLARGGVRGASPSAAELADVLVAMTERSMWELYAREHGAAEERELLATLEFAFLATLRAARGR